MYIIHRLVYPITLSLCRQHHRRRFREYYFTLKSIICELNSIRREGEGKYFAFPPALADVVPYLTFSTRATGTAPSSTNYRLGSPLPCINRLLDCSLPGCPSVGGCVLAHQFALKWTRTPCIDRPRHLRFVVYT